jgi:hydroxyacylglutathione hydrolase
MFLKRFYDNNLAQASYLVGCQAAGQAIVIDAAREVGPYLEEAEAQGLKIVAVTETHIHADYLSGSRQLAHQTGAKMYLSKEGGPDWQYQFNGDNDLLVGDGDIIKLGNLTLKVLHTPGHTPEHISFLLTDHPASDQPIGAFTGDFIFVGDVGRPDLLEKAAGLKDTMRKGAEDLYNSLEKFKELPDHIQIWPAHGAGSACGKALGAIPSSVLGYEKLTNWAFQCESKEEFVEQILDGQPEPPKYFAEMKRLNKIGPPLLLTSMPTEMDPLRLAEVLSKNTVIDLRDANVFAHSHPKGALFLPDGSALPTWAGWLLGYDEELYLLVKTTAQAEESIAALRSIGLDNVKGYILEASLPQSGVEMQSSHRITAEQVDEKAQNIVDVRSLKEWTAGHLQNCTHIHLGYLLDHLSALPDSPILYCQSGRRSLIASSLLQRQGLEPTDVVGGYNALRQRKVLVG